MNDLSITQSYLLCAVNDKGLLPGMRPERGACFLAAGLLELRLAGCLTLEKRKVSLCAPLPAELGYLRALYDRIAQKQPVKVDSLVERYLFSFSDRELRELLDPVGDALVALGLAEVRPAGLLGNQRGYVPTARGIPAVIEPLRAELLEDGPVTEEAAMLTILLEKGECLKPYFSRYEQDALRARLRQFAATPEGALVKEMVGYLELLIGICSSAGAAGAGGAG